MSTIAMWFKKTWLILGIAALGFGFMPQASAQALAPSNPVTTPIPTQTGGVRLAQAWVREQAIYNKLGTFFADVDLRIPRLQQLINKAKANGRDVSALQAALDNFSGAVKQAEPIYQSTSGTVSSHPGFDANGNVTDQTQALTTVKELGDKFKEIRQLILVPANALRDAMQAFRSANTPSATPIPTQSGG
jgi:hypothetical protein